MTASEAGSAPVAIYPKTALVRCPESLPKISLTKSEWDALTPQGQLRALERQAQEWSIVYFTCAIRHNTGADLYESQIVSEAEQ